MQGFDSKATTSVLDPRGLSARIAWTWFALGLAAWSLLPALRGYSPQAGWLSYWLVGAPLLVLATLHRETLVGRLRSILVRSEPVPGGVVAAGSQLQRRQGWRHRALRQGQARRLPPSRRSLVRTAFAALFT